METSFYYKSTECGFIRVMIDDGRKGNLIKDSHRLVVDELDQILVTEAFKFPAKGLGLEAGIAGQCVKFNKNKTEIISMNTNKPSSKKAGNLD